MIAGIIICLLVLLIALLLVVAFSLIVIIYAMLCWADDHAEQPLDVDSLDPYWERAAKNTILIITGEK